ncbi:MAG: DNA-formamidopyrimidine glycosylase family protein [Planctomycetota bacterium]
MPEGHTIHRLALDLNRELGGNVLKATSPQGRFASGARRLNGLRLNEIDPYGKHLFFRFERSRNLHVHLGLYGKFRRYKLPMPEPRGQVRLRIRGDAHGFDLNGPSACELLTDAACAKIVNRLGQDPLRGDANPVLVRDRLRRSRAEIGRLLLDQSVFAGVGNVYRAEALHIERIHPRRQARLITDVSASRVLARSASSSASRRMPSSMRLNT